MLNCSTIQVQLPLNVVSFLQRNHSSICFTPSWPGTVVKRLCKCQSHYQSRESRLLIELSLSNLLRSKEKATMPAWKSPFISLCLLKANYLKRKKKKICFEGKGLSVSNDLFPCNGTRPSGISLLVKHAIAL